MQPTAAPPASRNRQDLGKHRGHPVKSAKRTTYLSRVESDSFSKKWHNRRVTLFCNLLFSGKGIRKPRIMRCFITEISEGGAVARIEKTQIPDHLYLVIGSFDVLIGCSVVRRDPGIVHLRFLKELKSNFVDRLALMDSAYATLESLSPGTISAAEYEQPKLRPLPPAPNDVREGSLGHDTRYPKKP